MHYFETIKCKDNEIYNLHFHEKRIAKTIGKNINLSEYIYPINNDLLKCKVIYNEDEIVDVSYSSYTKKKIKTLQIVYDDTIEYSAKYEQRSCFSRLALQKETADDILIVQQNLLTDTSIANIAILLKNQWYTPKKPLLCGTTRARYIENGFLKEKDITLDMLQGASKIALLNAMIDFDILQEYTVLV